MTRDPQTIHPDKPFDEALRMMHDGRFRNVPVVEDGRPLGMVSVRDALDPELASFARCSERGSWSATEGRPPGSPGAGAAVHVPAGSNPPQNRQ